jgi:NitT/TauT family transport system substrate-binding protein
MMTRVLRAAAVAVAGLLLAACGGAPAASSTPGAQGSGGHPNLSGQTLRLIYSGTPSQATVPLAHAYGLLRQWGVDVQVNYGGTAQVVFGAMINDQADVLEFSPQGGLSGVDNGIDLVAFAMDAPRMDYALIGRPEIKTLKQLKGAKIGLLDTVGVNGIQASMALKAAGLSSKDATLIPTGGQSARVAALAAGRIDATMVGFSNYLQLKQQGYNLLYSYTKEQPKLVDGILWAKRSWLQKHHDLAVAFNQAILESFRWFNGPKSKDAWVQETQNLIKGADADVAGQMYQVYRQNDMYPNNAILDSGVMDFNQQQYVQYGGLSKTIPVKQWVDATYAQEALRKAGQA